MKSKQINSKAFWEKCYWDHQKQREGRTKQQQQIQSKPNQKMKKKHFLPFFCSVLKILLFSQSFVSSNNNHPKKDSEEKE